MSGGAFTSLGAKLGVNWGEIFGNIEDQTDLWAYLSAIVPENGYDNRTDSSIAFDNATRTFSITATGSSFFVNSVGSRFEKTGTINLVIPDSEGLHFIYFDENGVLTSTQVFTDDIILIYGYTSVVYWDATNKEQVLFGDERHGNKMNAVTHLYNHYTRGTAYETGLSPGDLTTEGNGDLDIHAQFSTNAGTIWDEDIKIDVPASVLPAAVPIIYKDTVAGYWRKIAATSFMVSTTGSGRAAWNNIDAGGVGVWGLSEIGNGNFVLMHLYASDDTVSGYFVVMGQNEYTSVTLAREGAETEITNIDVAGLPIIEQLPVATFIFETNNGYANAVKSRLRETDTGDSFIDWRTGGVSSGSGGGTSPSTIPWGSITGTLSNQIDLQNALNAKANSSHAHTKTDITDFNDADYATAAQGVLADTALQNIVEDVTPQLGGNLDPNGFDYLIDSAPTAKASRTAIQNKNSDVTTLHIVPGDTAADSYLELSTDPLLINSENFYLASLGSSNQAVIGTSKDGTGTVRDISIQPNGTEVLRYSVSGYTHLKKGVITDVEVLGSNTITPSLGELIMKSRAVNGNITINEPTVGNGICKIKLNIDASGPYTVTLGAGVSPIGTIPDLLSNEEYIATIERYGSTDAHCQILRSGV